MNREACEAVFLLQPLSGCLFLLKLKTAKMQLELLVDEPSKENTLFIRAFMFMERADIRQTIFKLQ